MFFWTLVCHSPNKSTEFVSSATIQLVTLHVFVIFCQNLWLSHLQMLLWVVILTRNWLLKGCDDYDLRRLQGFQNYLCRIVTHTSRFSHITSHLIDLHWLPVCQRDFKWCLLIFKCLKTGRPSYFHSDLSLYCCILNTRRSNPLNHYLTKVSFVCKVHKSKRFFGSSLSVGAPQLWNSLPLGIRTATSINSFRCQLKTYLFDIAYPRHPTSSSCFFFPLDSTWWQPFYLLWLYVFWLLHLQIRST